MIDPGLPCRARFTRRTRGAIWISAALAASLLGCGGGGGTGLEENWEGVADGDPIAAPMRDEARLAVQRTREVVIATADGREIGEPVAKRLESEGLPPFYGRISWSPDGRALAFTVTNPPGTPGAGIHRVRADGSGPTRLTRGGRSAEPVWAPDGRAIVFTSLRGWRKASLWTMNTDGSNQRQLTPWQENVYDVPGSFSPDGSTLAFTRAESLFREPAEGRTQEIWVVDTDGTNLRRLAERARDPAYSPDGERIAFASDRDESSTTLYGDLEFFTSELYVMDADGGNPVRLTRSEEDNDGPSWSPDGARIAYQRSARPHGSKEVVIINPDGTCPTTILRGPKKPVGGRFIDYAAPAWRPGSARRGGGRLRC